MSDHSTGDTLTALTLNMQAGQVWDPVHPDDAPYDIAGTAEFLRAQDADVIFLQEVEMPVDGRSGGERTPNYDALRAALPDYASWFAWPSASRPQLPFGIGLAIFSRLPLRECFHVVLPTADVRFEFRGTWWMPAERSLIGATATWKGRDITLLDTHLQAWFMIETNADEHPEQRQVLATVIKGRKRPLLLGGDFNCTAQEGTVAAIEAAGVSSVQKKSITWHRMPHVLDHLFHSPEFTMVDHEVVGTSVSDHDAVKAWFRLA